MLLELIELKIFDTVDQIQLIFADFIVLANWFTRTPCWSSSQTRRFEMSNFNFRYAVTKNKEVIVRFVL